MSVTLRYLFIILATALLAGCGPGNGGESPPSAPSTVRAEARSGFIEVTWRHSGDNLSGFVVRRGIENEAAADFLLIAELGADERAYRDEANLDPSTRYRYSVASKNDLEESAPVLADTAVQPLPVEGDARLTVVKKGRGQGVVVSDPAGIACVQRPEVAGDDCLEDYSEGQEVTLSAQPDAGSVFAGWEGACSGTGACQVTMDSSKAVAAVFSPPESTLTVTKDGSGSGTVIDGNSSGEYIDCGGDCDYTTGTGTILVLEAGPDEGSLFAGWSGCPEVRSNGDCKVQINTDLTVTATFSEPSLNIESFTASPKTVAPNGAVTLSWEVTGDDAYTLSLRNSLNDEVLAVTGRTSLTVNPSASVTYTLSATSDIETDTDTETVTVGSEPNVTLFRVRGGNDAIATGSSAVLEWEVAGAGDITVTISGVSGTFGREGTTTVRPSSSGDVTYMLSATSSFGSDTATETITVGDAPVIRSFIATPPSITAGGEVVLEWTVTGDGAITLTLEGDGESRPVTGGSATVQPDETTPYTLLAESEFGDDDATVTAIATSPLTAPTISAFTATPETITSGEESTLRWTVSGTGPITVTISGVDGTFGATDSVSVSPTTTTEYTLTATNAEGEDTATTTVMVNPVPTAPDIQSFTANPSIITEGEESTLSWNVTGTEPITVTISGVGGTFDAADSVSVSPDSTTTYTLTAMNAQGADTASVEVTVNPAPTEPTITSFTADPATITSGDESTLRWTVTGTPPVTLTLDDGTGPTQVTGTEIDVSPTTTVEYTLTATNAQGADTASVTVTVNPAPTAPTISSFTATPATIAAGSSSTLSWTVTGAESITLSIDNGIGTVTGTETTVSPAETTTYTLTAANAQGAATAIATVTVDPSP